MSWFYSFLFVIIIFSIPTYWINEIGFGRFKPEHWAQGIFLFQGITNHPQLFSLVLSLSLAISSGNLLSKNLSFIDLGIFLISILFIYYTKGRVGVLAFSLALIIFLMSIFTSNSIRYHFLIILRSNVNLLILFLALCLVPIIFHTISPIAYKFILKRGNVTSLKESFDVSRSSQINRMTKNIDENFWNGIGFGIPSSTVSINSRIKNDPIFGLPVSVITEKGFLPIAVFEENGIIGFVLFTLFMISLFLKFNLNINNITPFLLATTSIMGNIGEMYFFSFGGAGLLMWLSIGIALKKR